MAPASSSSRPATAMLGLLLQQPRLKVNIIGHGTRLASSYGRPPDRNLSVTTAGRPMISSLRPRARPALAAKASSSRRTFSSTSPSFEASSSAAAAAAAPAAENVADGYIASLVPYLHDLPAYLHIAPGPHAYAISILILTLVLRAGITLPATIWQRSRTRRMAEEVMPRWTILKEKLPPSIAKRCRREGKNYEEFHKVLQTELKGHLKQLLRIYKCSPLPSVLVPLALQVPLFLAVTSLLRHSVITPDSPLLAEIIPWWSPPPELTAKFAASAEILRERGLDGEALAKLTTPVGPSLGDKDRTMLGPIGAGLIMLANVELGQWARRQSKLDSQGEARAKGKTTTTAKEAEQDKEGEGAVQNAELAELEPVRSVVAGNIMRALSIAFVPFLSISPGAIVVYCLSTFSFTLLQNAVFTFLDRRRASRLKLAASSLPSGTYSAASGSKIGMAPESDAVLSSILSSASGARSAATAAGAAKDQQPTLRASGSFVRQVPNSAKVAAATRMGGQVGAAAGGVTSGDAAAPPGSRRARVPIVAEQAASKDAGKEKEQRGGAAGARSGHGNSASAVRNPARRRKN